MATCVLRGLAALLIIGNWAGSIAATPERGYSPIPFLGGIPGCAA